MLSALLEINTSYVETLTPIPNLALVATKPESPQTHLQVLAALLAKGDLSESAH
jgi:hypothetical protein